MLSMWWHPTSSGWLIVGVREASCQACWELRLTKMLCYMHTCTCTHTNASYRKLHAFMQVICFLWNFRPATEYIINNSANPIQAPLHVPKLFRWGMCWNFTLSFPSSFPATIFYHAVTPLLAVKASIKMAGVTITSGEMVVPQALLYHSVCLRVYFWFCVECPEQIKHSHL